MVAGQSVILNQPLRLGLRILKELEVELDKPPTSAPYATRKAYAVQYRQAANNLWVHIKNGRSTIKGIDPLIFFRFCTPT